MNDNEYYNNLLVIYQFLQKALIKERPSVKDGYIADAMGVIEAIMKKRARQ
ncbi:MAG: hypothetical protein J6S67_21750 [Methanobrevibacter sp.]|nr:hypothetical protein [Methanobrevibacter sp.]